MVRGVTNTMYFVMQNDLRLHHSRTEWLFLRLGVQEVNKSMWSYRTKLPSPSPLSHGVVLFVAVGSKMGIPRESGDLRFHFAS